MKDYDYYRAYWKLKSGLIFKFLYYTGACRLYANGDFVDARFRWFHPFSWVFFVLGIFICLFTTSTIKTTFMQTFMLQPYFKEHPKKLHWFNPHREKSWTGKFKR